jgi:hypothetical protein
MKTNQLAKFLFLGAVAIGAAPAFAGPTLGVVGTGTYGLPTATGTTTASGRLGYGGGLTVEFPFGSTVGLEIDGFYVSQEYNLGGTNTRVNTIMPAASLVLHMGRIFSINLGGFYSFAFSPPANLANDYGVLGGLSLDIPMGATTAFTIGGRFNYSLADIDTGGGTINAHDVQALIGLKFGGGRR